MKPIIALAIVTGLAFAINPGSRPERTHDCKYHECPYVGTPESKWTQAVTEEVGEEYTDTWCIDLLHLKHPYSSYEELEAILFGGQPEREVFNLQDYQLQYHEDTLFLYDGNRLVGWHISHDYTHGAWIDSTVLADNL